MSSRNTKAPAGGIRRGQKARRGRTSKAEGSTFYVKPPKRRAELFPGERPLWSIFLGPDMVAAAWSKVHATIIVDALNRYYR